MSDQDRRLIEKIAERAQRMYADHGQERALLDILMDLTATHANGCPLDLVKFLTFDNFNFAHDIGGINAHLDRQTGQLTRCFLPRCSLRRA